MPIEGWAQHLLGDLLTLEYGSGLIQADRSGEGYPVYGSSGLVGKHLQYLVEGPGIIVGRKGTVGAVIWSENAFWPIDTTYYVQPSSRFDFRWLYWRLLSLPLSHLDSSTGVPGLNRNDVYALCVSLPPLPEQRRIAEILDMADEAIHAAERLIAKLRQVKAGLLHDLLTCGVDTQGNLRDPVAHPEQFKDSPLGRIPREWEIHKIGEFAHIKYGISTAIDQALEIGISTITLPCVSQHGDLSLNRDLLAFTARVHVSDNDFLQRGDLLFNWRNGSPFHLGKTAYFDAQGEYTHVGFLLCIRSQQEICHSRYLWWRLCYMKDCGVFMRAKIQVNNTYNSGELAATAVILPTLDEQKRIVIALDAHDARIRAEEATLAKLRRVKAGLMDDLLTGRVRV